VLKNGQVRRGEVGGTVRSLSSLRFPPQTAAALRVTPPNISQPFYANDAAVASEPADAVALIVDTEVFEKDQSAVAFALDHGKSGFCVHA